MLVILQNERDAWCLFGKSPSQRKMPLVDSRIMVKVHCINMFPDLIIALDDKEKEHFTKIEQTITNFDKWYVLLTKGQ